jgi:putative transposase
MCQSRFTKTQIVSMLKEADAGRPPFGLTMGPNSSRSGGIERQYIQPGKPDGNAFIERVNRTYRAEVLNAYVFESLDQVREVSAEWLQSYNEERPHEALVGLPPSLHRVRLEARSSPLKLSP